MIVSGKQLFTPGNATADATAHSAETVTSAYDFAGGHEHPVLLRFTIALAIPHDGSRLQAAS